MTRYLATILFLLLVLPASNALAQAKSLKVALVLPGPVTDGTFNSAANDGIKKAEKSYKITVSIRENTANAEIEETLLNYAREGYDVIIGHGFQFAEPTLKIHKQFPKTWFIVTTAQVAAEPNVASFDNGWGQAGYIAGAVAALVSKSGVIGHIGGIPVPPIKRYNEGFERGAKRMRPDVQVMTAYVGSFSDIAKGKEITMSLIERGADVVTSTGNENVMGTIQAAKESNILAIGTAFDAAPLAPDTIVTTPTINMDVNIDQAVSKVIDGSIEAKVYLLGIQEGGVGLAPFRNFDDKLPAGAKDKILQLVADMKAGKVDDLPNER